ncbi:MAG: hypothetical protein CMJ34_03300 [Phycisphaerae bacterium]|nr:hypothetical protein [Phycisphaerae bacterium]
MIGRTMDLRPEDVRRRVRDAGERVRIARFAVVAGVMLCVAWMSASWRLSIARADLASATERAEDVVRVEAELQDARASLERDGRELAAWRRVTIPIATGRLIDTVVEILPESATIERLELDATSLIAVPAGHTRAGIEGTTPPRRVEGDIEGFASTDEDVALLVDALRSRPFFREVRVVTTRHRELGSGTEVAREFQIAFEVDLDQASPAPAGEPDPSEGGGR